jgi:hypothetical protein
VKTSAAGATFLEKSRPKDFQAPSATGLIGELEIIIFEEAVHEVDKLQSVMATSSSFPPRTNADKTLEDAGHAARRLKAAM